MGLKPLAILTQEFVDRKAGLRVAESVPFAYIKYFVTL
jgi:hypothetical protein